MKENASLVIVTKMSELFYKSLQLDMQILIVLNGRILQLLIIRLQIDINLLSDSAILLIALELIFIILLIKHLNYCWSIIIAIV
jgi:hypothetical protein